MQTINPATGQPSGHFEQSTRAEAERSVARAVRSFPAWHELGFVERGARLKKAAELLRSRAKGYSELMAREMGKPVKEGLGEIDKCAWACEYYAENGKRFLDPQQIETDATSSYVCFEPLGVVFAIMPWNFPFWQMFRFAAPALMAGNAIALKHSSLVPGCAEAIAEVLHDAAVPSEIVANLRLSKEDAEALIEHDGVAAVTFTGSTSGGASVAARAGRAVKKCVLELGGSDPYLILEDADIQAAAEACAASRLINNGQSCIAAKRFIAVQPIRRDFEAALVDQMRAYEPGDPLQPETRLGPMASVELRDQLHEQVERSIAAGAALRLGGKVPGRAGAWYPPTLLGNVGPGMPAYSEELFGPVAAVIEARDEDDAIRIANDSQFGLGAAVFSRDAARAEQLARHRLVAGSCFVNAFVRSDPRLPFGGTRRSGYGRELSLFGIQEFVNIKTIYVK